MDKPTPRKPKAPAILRPRKRAQPHTTPPKDKYPTPDVHSTQTVGELTQDQINNVNESLSIAQDTLILL